MQRVLVRSKAFRHINYVAGLSPQAKAPGNSAWEPVPELLSWPTAIQPGARLPLQPGSSLRGSQHQCRAFKNTPPHCPWTFLMLCHQHTRGGVFITNLE